MPLPTGTIANLVACGLIVPTRDICIILPGGATICIQFPSVSIPDPMELILQLLAQVNAALAPLMPLFKILQCFLLLVEAVKAVPDAIFPPNPEPIIETLIKVGVCVADLLKLLPIISIPFTIVALLDALIAFLGGLDSQLHIIIAANTALIVAALNPADPGAALIISCEKGNMGAYLANLNEAMKPLNQLLGVINLLMVLINQDPIPSFAEIGADAQAFLEPLDNIVSTLRAIRAAIPLP